jgi:hypothetical protein
MLIKLSTIESQALKKSSRKRKRNALETQRLAAKRKAIALWYEKGGALFKNWTKKFYRTHDGEPLTWDDPWQHEFCLAFGNPWFARVVIEKAAQVGFTEFLIAFGAFYLAYLRLHFGLGFEADKKMMQMSAKRVQPAFRCCEAIQQIQQETKEAIGGGQDIDSRQTIMVGNVILSLFSAKFGSKDEEYQAPPSMRSFTAFGMGCDEWGLMPDGALDVGEARMARTPLRSSILRAGSTPSYEGASVDLEIRRATYLFQWHLTCPHCQTEQFLDPFGNFLRPVMVTEDGVEEERYISNIGHPLSWFHHKENPPGVPDADIILLDRKERQIYYDTAYVGCQCCSKELRWKDLTEGEFKCVNTGISLRELCVQTLDDQEVITETIALRLPKLASRSFRAAERIKFMFTTRKPDDGIHQFLGKPYSLGGGKISLTRLMSCVGLEVPLEAQTWQTVIVAGVDQGRNSNWAIVQKWYIPPYKNAGEAWNDSHVEVLAWEEIQGIEEGIDDLVRRHGITIVFLDNEPEFQSAAKYALSHPPEGGKKRYETPGQVYLVDQMQLKGGEQFQRKPRKIQSTRKDTEIIVYNIDRTYALDCVKWRIYKKRQHFPAGLYFDPKQQGNLFHHYLTSDRLPDGRWLEPQGQPDHWFSANSFCEIGMQLVPHEPGQKRFAFSGTSKR